MCVVAGKIPGKFTPSSVCRSVTRGVLQNQRYSKKSKESNAVRWPPSASAETRFVTCSEPVLPTQRIQRNSKNSKNSKNSNIGVNRSLKPPKNGRRRASRLIPQRAYRNVRNVALKLQVWNTGSSSSQVGIRVRHPVSFEITLRFSQIILRSRKILLRFRQTN